MSINNKVQLVGNVGQDPEIMTFDSGVKKAKFSIAINSRYKDSSGEFKEDTEWFSIVAWKGTAGIIENHVTKGDRICIEGVLKQDRFTDKDGNNRSAVHVLATSILLLGTIKNKEQNMDPVAHVPPEQIPNDHDSFIDDLPF